MDSIFVCFTHFLRNYGIGRILTAISGSLSGSFSGVPSRRRQRHGNQRQSAILTYVERNTHLIALATRISIIMKELDAFHFPESFGTQ